MTRKQLEYANNYVNNARQYLESAERELEHCAELIPETDADISDALECITRALNETRDLCRVYSQQWQQSNAGIKVTGF